MIHLSYTNVIKSWQYIVILIAALIILAHFKNTTLLLTISLITIIIISSMEIFKVFTQPIETFAEIQDILTQIKQFQTQVSPAMDELSNNTDKLTVAQANNIQESINQLGDKLGVIINTLDQSSKDQLGATTRLNYGNVDQVYTDIQTAKSIQLSRLRDLQDQLYKTEQLLATAELQKESAKYKPIKVYSSCIVSNADGTYSS
jgi:hypothetical protein